MILKQNFLLLQKLPTWGVFIEVLYESLIKNHIVLYMFDKYSTYTQKERER